MKSFRPINLALFVFVLSLIIAGPKGMTSSVSAATDDATDVMAMLTEKLKLSPDQAKKLQPEANKFITTLDQLKADQEKEDADPGDLVHGAKKAQEEYLKAVKQILTPEQYKQYSALKEEAVKSMCNSLADIQLMDLQPKVGFSDEQLNQLVPVVGDALFQVITLAWQHAGKRLRVG
ncbi:MAG: hypothetical protein AMJ54_15590 [Deltaproteobacteria bacterium SG8_13]|nr:MAG: hypothetical protein AMJ54_15590 [Deltaproteobacteria bacterium SG8_13]